MIETFYDEIKNIVTVVYEGNVNAVEEKQLYLKLQDLLPKCRRGFRLLVDLSPVNRVEEEAVPVIKMIMDLLNQHGLSEVIRIIPEPDKDIGFNILSIFHYGKNVKVLTCQTPEEVHW